MGAVIGGIEGASRAADAGERGGSESKGAAEDSGPVGRTPKLAPIRGVRNVAGVGRGRREVSTVAASSSTVAAAANSAAETTEKRGHGEVSTHAREETGLT